MASLDAALDCPPSCATWYRTDGQEGWGASGRQGSTLSRVAGRTGRPSSEAVPRMVLERTARMWAVASRGAAEKGLEATREMRPKEAPQETNQPPNDPLVTPSARCRPIAQQL